MAHVERSVESGASPSQRQGHAIIAGFGLPGRAAAERFDAAGVPYSIIELNPGTVERCAETGTMIIAGDVNEEATL
ncbi:MAG: NAD-binding protein, partial [Tepidisphaeraceae bacterium]